MTRRRKPNPRNPNVGSQARVPSPQPPQPPRRQIPDHADFNGDAPNQDSRAEEEAQLMANGRDLQRSEQFKDLLNALAMAMLAVVALGILLSFLFWFWHLLTPEEWNFLDDAQLRRIETVVFSGILVGVAQTYLRKHI